MNIMLSLLEKIFVYIKLTRRGFCWLLLRKRSCCWKSLTVGVVTPQDWLVQRGKNWMETGLCSSQEVVFPGQVKMFFDTCFITLDIQAVTAHWVGRELSFLILSPVLSPSPLSQIHIWDFRHSQGAVVVAEVHLVLSVSLSFKYLEWK